MGRPGRFWLLLGVGFGFWLLGQIIFLGYVNVLRVQVPAISLADVPFLAFYLPAFAALFPESGDEPGVDWARTLDLAQVGIVLGSIYLYFFFALNLGVTQRVITLHFGFLDSYSLLNILLVGSYLYAWGASGGQARALYGRMAAIFGLYSIGDTLNTDQVIRGEVFSGDWLDLSYSLSFALATVVASRWPAEWDEERDVLAASPQWRLFPLLPPALVLIVAGSVAQGNLTLASILIGGVSLSEELATLRPGAPVILMSGYAEPATAAERPGRILLQKPFPLDVLAATIRERLAGIPAKSATPGG